jgi:hypothetical protein
MRAVGLATVGREPDPPEDAERFLVGQPENLSDAQAPCGWREKEVLRHDTTNIW